MTVLRTPVRLSAAMASRAPGLTTSEMTMWPAYAPSTAMWTIVPTLRHSCQEMPSSSMSRLLPAATLCPSTVATTPRPLRSSMSVTRERSSSPSQAFCKLLLIGCEDAHSASAAYARSLRSSMGLWCTPVTSNTPCVSVPVLSKTTVFVFDRVSR